MAFESEHAVNVITPTGIPGRRHVMKFTVSNGGAVLIDKFWIDNESSNLTLANTPYVNTSFGSGQFPKMKWFPFFLDPTYVLSGSGFIESDFLSSDTTGQGDAFPYQILPNVDNGSIIHPLSDWTAFGFYNGFNTSGYLTTSMRDNYRLKKRIYLQNLAGTSDTLTMNILFCTNVIDNYSGVLRIHYQSMNGFGVSEQRQRIISLTGSINKTNITEIDYTSSSIISEIEGVNLESPFTSIELG